MEMLTDHISASWENWGARNDQPTLLPVKGIGADPELKRFFTAGTKNNKGEYLGTALDWNQLINI